MSHVDSRDRVHFRILQTASRRARVLVGFAALFCAAAASAHVYQYDVVSGAAIPVQTNDNQCENGNGSLDVPFSVSDTFTTTGVAVGLNISHAERGDIRVMLVAPDGDLRVLFEDTGDDNIDYDILVSSNGEGARNDGDSDPISEPYFSRLVTSATNLNVAESANGTWTLRLCDDDNNGVNGTLNRARLVLLSSAPASPVCTGTKLTYDWGSNGNGAVFSSTSVGGVTLSQSSTTDFGAGRNFGTFWNFRTDTDSLGGHSGFYSLYMDADNTGGSNDFEDIGQLVVFGFSVPVADLAFSSLDSDRASGDFEDIIRVEGVHPDGGFARFSRAPVSGSPVFQEAGDTIEADSPCDNGSTCATENYAFDQAVSSLNFFYLAGDDVPFSPGDQVIGISDFAFCAFDYGDAPSSYGTLLSGGARHVLGTRDLWLGANPPDGESDGQTAGGAATADDIDQIQRSTTRTASRSSAPARTTAPTRCRSRRRTSPVRPRHSSATSIGTAAAPSTRRRSGRHR